MVMAVWQEKMNPISTDRTADHAALESERCRDRPI
jgi:hypothetical protein